MDGIDKACSATESLQLGTLYGPKSPILPQKKMFSFHPNKHESRQALAEMETKKLLKSSIYNRSNV